MSSTTEPVGPDGLVAILRGLAPRDASAVGATLYQAGLRAMEVPLNSPDPFRSIAALRDRLPDDAVVGAGTVRTVDEVHRTHDAGGTLVVSPHVAPPVVRAAVGLGMRCLPGVATVTEAFVALDSGARALKVFPATQVGPSGLRAWRSVLPRGTGLVPVGGVGAANLGEWWAAGATGFGVGGSLFSPSATLEDVADAARRLVDAYRRTVPAAS